MGSGRGGGRVAEGVHDSAGAGVSVRQREGLEAERNRDPAALLLRSQKGEEERRRRGIELDSGHFAGAGAGRGAAVYPADGDGGSGGQCAVAGARATREACTALGLELFARKPASSVTAVKAPAGMDSGAIVKGFKDRFGAVITNGQGSMKGQIFRLAHLGYFDITDMFGIIAGLELILRANGHNVELGKGVAAVQRVYEAAQAAPKLAAA